MGKVIIQCPECKQKLQFDEKPGYQDMQVICPRCGYKAKTSVYMAGSRMRDGQPMSPPPGGGGYRPPQGPHMNHGAGGYRPPQGGAGRPAAGPGLGMGRPPQGPGPMGRPPHGPGPMGAGPGFNPNDTQIFAGGPSAGSIGQIRVISTGEVQFLQSGDNVIGRRAASIKADIAVSNDPFMSRRHVNIKVVRRGNSYEHLLEELTSTNMPKVNGRQIEKGDIIKLKFGDTITLGRTDLRLESGDSDSTRLY